MIIIDFKLVLSYERNIVACASGDGPPLERLELEMQVGPKAAEKLVKEISFVDIDNTEESTILLKLREILEGGLRNVKSNSLSSSASENSNSSVSSSRSVSSSMSSSSASAYVTKVKH